jgi:streptogramin lyase
VGGIPIEERTMTLSNGPIATVRLLVLLTGLLALSPARAAAAFHPTFSWGDVFVSLRSGQVMWFSPDGTLNATLVNAVPSKAEGMGFDTAGNLLVTHYCLDPTCRTGNTVERYNPNGVSIGAFGSGYGCNPYAIATDRLGRVYVGQADCSGDLLAFDGFGVPLAAFDVVSEPRGSARIDLAADGCTMFYTSQGPNVKRFDVCANRQLPDFNLAPIPGGTAQALRILPDGGVLVAAVGDIVRLNASGVLVQRYDVPEETDLFLGLDLSGDGTFWTSNYGSSNLYRFDIASGAVLSSFNTGTPSTTVKDVLVRR